MKKVTRDNLNEILRKHTVWLNGEPNGERADLYGANLSGANLSGAYLSRANLSGAYLSRANLSGAYLYGADLYGADLYGAYLYGADLYGANLSGAYLSGADLYGANLRRANLRGANLSGANLSGAKLYGAKNLNANIFNPSKDLSTEHMTESAIMEECLRNVRDSDILVYSSVDECVGAGVYTEVMEAKKQGKIIFYIHQDELRNDFELNERPEKDRTDRLCAKVSPEW